MENDSTTVAEENRSNVSDLEIAGKTSPLIDTVSPCPNEENITEKQTDQRTSEDMNQDNPAANVNDQNDNKTEDTKPTNGSNETDVIEDVSVEKSACSQPEKEIPTVVPKCESSETDNSCAKEDVEEATTCDNDKLAIADPSVSADTKSKENAVPDELEDTIEKLVEVPENKTCELQDNTTDLKQTEEEPETIEIDDGKSSAEIHPGYPDNEKKSIEGGNVDLQETTAEVTEAKQKNDLVDVSEKEKDNQPKECVGIEDDDLATVASEETVTKMQVDEMDEVAKGRTIEVKEVTSEHSSSEQEKEEQVMTVDGVEQKEEIVEDNTSTQLNVQAIMTDKEIASPISEQPQEKTKIENSEKSAEHKEKADDEKPPAEGSDGNIPEIPEDSTIDKEKKTKEDDDIILIDDEKTTKSEEDEQKSEKTEPSSKKLRLSTEEKVEPKTVDQDADQNKNDSVKQPEKNRKEEGEPKEGKTVSEDEEVVLVDSESKTSETTVDGDKAAELVDSESKTSETTVVGDKAAEGKAESKEKEEGTDKKDISIESDAIKSSAKPQKDNSDEVMVVDSDSKESPDAPETDKKTEAETTADEKAEPPKKDKDAESENKSDQKVAQNGTPTKRFVLDENTGMFEEKETPPEEPVPQVFGDSDEDVVMVDNYVTTDRKSASKPPPKVQPQIAAPSKTVAPKAPAPAQPETAKKQSVAVKPSPKPRPATVSVECINAECKKNTRETAPAPAFALNFFGIPKKTKKQRICLTCYDDVVQKYSILGGAVLDQQPLLFCEMPRKNELVEISDSSEEEEDEDVKMEAEKPLPPEIISLVESELNDIISNTFEKININQQLDWTEQIMKQKIAYNTKLSDEINNELNQLQRKVDRIHLQLYSKSRPRFQDLPPINIFEMEYNRQSLVQQTIQVNRQYSPQRPLSQATQQQLQQQQQQSKAGQVTLGTQASASSVSSAKDEFSRPPVIVGQFYFAVKHKLLSNWAECQVVEAVTVADKSLYKVNFLYNQGGGSAPIKVVPAKYLAYRHSFNVKLPLGTRVIARFDAGTTQPTVKTQQGKGNSYYPGIIAESFGKYNRNRYLIFFDDGYAQYVTHADVRVVCEESKEVWSDIHPHSQEFIKNYLMNYRSQRPMVQVKVGQRIITEWKGKWIYAKVIDIDASLVQLHFPDDNRYEWIYRGSTRLGPLYQEKALSLNKASNKFSKFQKRNEPSIEYITIDDDDEEADQTKKQEAKKTHTPQEQALQALKNLQMSQADSANRSVAKKSTFHRPTPSSQPSAVFMNSSTIYCEDDRPKGKIVYYTAKKHLPPLKYKPHECNPSCLFKITHNLKSYSPMAKPLLSGWERQLCKMRYKKVFVVYRAPCGRRVRNMYELHMYLRMTRATLNVENFDFDPMIHCLAEYVIENHIYHNPDLSDGKEFMAVPCVNYFDDSKPPPCIYSTERIPTEGVNLNVDSDFLCGCDCDDDCIDKSRCQCWQMTVAGAKFGNPNTSIDNIGYVYKRLQEPVVTGIYECNARCKCKSNCLNRVVQHPLMTKLQVFKTSNRGWGIRCLNDVAKGSFICIYSGHLLTEEAGNMICQMNENKAGDEYFADLDYIETVEQLKEGYETDVVETDSEADSDEPDYDAKQDSAASDDDFTSTSNPSDAAVKTRSQVRRDSRPSTQKTEQKKSHKKKEDAKTGSDDEREMVNLIPNSDMTKEDAPSPTIKFRSVRKYYGKHEQIYIMDAKKSGNLGRYFNHSCNPNLFVQNVFVDTHDLRFPWVAFFALCNVRAGSELTWNYNYDVGSVPGKVLYCQCGAENCRQRLL